MTLLSLALAVLASAAPATTGSTFVNGRVTRNLSGTFEVYEPFLQVNQWVSPWGGGASVSGFPLSGNVSRGGNFFRFFGPGLDADVNEFAGSYRVNARITRNGRQAFFSFTLHASGPLNDPAYPPSFDVWDAGSNLRLTPSAGGRDYQMSGWIDRDRFGSEGVALVGIIAGLALDRRPGPVSPPSLALVDPFQ